MKLRRMMSGKIHRATVTAADLNYVGSVTVDLELLNAAGMLPNEAVDVVDVTNGARLTTYIIPAAPGSGTLQINGAAAHLVNPGDTVILISYVEISEDELGEHRPNVVFVDADNHITGTGNDPCANCGEKPQ